MSLTSVQPAGLLGPYQGDLDRDLVLDLDLDSSLGLECRCTAFPFSLLPFVPLDIREGLADPVRDRDRLL